MDKKHRSLEEVVRQIFRKHIPVFLSIVMVFSMLPSDLASDIDLVNKAEAAIALSKPYTAPGTNKVTWDCVYFGSYPQTEIKPGDSIYTKLASGTWDGNGDQICDGERYHKLSSSEATHKGSGSGYFDWGSSDHYFRYDPIKWRVLKVSSMEVLLLSDKLLDCQMYDLTDASGVTWENCYLRSWIRNKFVGRAFTSNQQSAIISKFINNNAYPLPLIGSTGGKSTEDQVFLLSSDEVATSQTAADYGFINSTYANERRVAKATDFAKAMGVKYYSSNEGYWWLRTQGSTYFENGYCRSLALEPTGELKINGYDFTSDEAGIRPALYLNRSTEFMSYYSYAGTVSSDGTIGDGLSGDNPEVSIVAPSTYTINYDANGGSGAPAAQTRKSGETLILSSKEPIRSGYRFVGWNSSKSAQSASYKAGGEYTDNGDVILYAVWVSDGTGTGDNPGSETGSDDGSDPVVIPPKTQTITASDKTVAIKTPAFPLGARAEGDGKLTYKSSKTSVATVSSSGKITVRNYGITNITITAAATTAYKKAVKTVKITVVPKKMKIKSVKSPKKKQLKVTWVKDKAASGYHVQICPNNKFDGHTFQKGFSKKYNTTKKPVTGLTSKKYYYVRVRSYKKVNGTILNGIWSYSRMIKIK